MAERKTSPVSREPPDELLDYVCYELARGRSLRSICDDPGVPDIAIVTHWIIHDVKGFAQLYGHARQAQATIWGDEIMEIADDRTIPWQDRRVMVDTRKWMLSKVLPKVYGDRMTIDATIEHKGAGVSPEMFRYVVSRMAALGESMPTALQYASKHPVEVRRWLQLQMRENIEEAEVVEDGNGHGDSEAGEVVRGAAEGDAEAPAGGGDGDGDGGGAEE